MSYSRRAFLGVAGAGALSLFACTSGSTDPVEIEMRSGPNRSEVWFDPVGLFLPPGRTVRWVIREKTAHTTTAYHPATDDHPLRIPKGAEPWDSGYLHEPGAAYEKTFATEGVYDYYCKPHEAAGMVGRIVAGTPAGPGSRPFGYWKNDPDGPAWTEVPEAAQEGLPLVERIIEENRVRRADL